MTKYNILLLEEVFDEILLKEGEGILFGSSNFFKTDNERQNFLFYYLQGQVPNGITPSELNLIPVTTYNLANKSDQAKLWMYELNKNSGFEQFCAREGTDSLAFFEINKVIIGTEIIQLDYFELISWDKFREKMPHRYVEYTAEISRLKHIAKDYVGL